MAADLHEELLGAVLGGLGLIMVGVVCFSISLAHGRGRLERNGLLGIRTRATLRSDAAWHAGHDAAAPWLRGIGVMGLTCGPVVILLAALGATVAHLVVMVGGYAAVVVLTVLAGVAADRAAKAVTQPPDAVPRD